MWTFVSDDLDLRDARFHSEAEALDHLITFYMIRRPIPMGLKRDGKVIYDQQALYREAHRQQPDITTSRLDDVASSVERAASEDLRQSAYARFVKECELVGLDPAREIASRRVTAP